MTLQAPPVQLVAHAALYRHLATFVDRVNSIPWPRGAVASSWWRGLQRNEDVGGADWSQHLVGLALDVVVPNGTEQGVLAAARAAGLTAIYHNAGSGWHVHVQLGRAGFLRQLVSAAPSLGQLLGVAPSVRSPQSGTPSGGGAPPPGATRTPPTYV